MFKDKLTKSEAPYNKIWLMFFLYTGLVAAFVQLIALPYIVPGWHAGNGLLVGGDWLWFHQLAVDMSEKISINGWHEWMLRPYGQAPAGIAAAIYAITVPKPWTIIPLNAALHASAALVLILIMQRFALRWQYAVISALPFAFYPSAMTWYTQLHKDGFFILGSLVFLYGWVILVERITDIRDFKTLIKPYLLIMGGAALVWVVRPYGVQMMQGLSLIMVVGICVFALAYFKKILSSFKMRLLFIPMYLFLIVISLTPFTWQGVSLSESPGIVLSMEIGIEEPSEYWKSILPSKIDSIFYTLATVRNGFIDSYPNAGSNIDNNRFCSALDLLSYTPRAIETAFLAPFPNMWFSSGTTINSGFIRKISGIEMLGIYPCLLFVLLSFKKWRHNPTWWIVMFFCGSMMTIYAFITVNIGSLYRVRYGFIMIIVALGITYCLNQVGDKKHKPIAVQCDS